MKLNSSDLEKIYFGALWFEEDQEGYLHAHHFTREQIAYFKSALQFWYERCTASTTKTLEISTTATRISFEYKITWVGSYDTIELVVDGMPSQIIYLKDIEKEGRIEFELVEGKKEVIIYLPADSTVIIKEFTINESYTPVKKNEKVLWMGDSITMGYGPLRSAHTYVSVINRKLNCDILNQGVGGYIYDKNSVQDMGYLPERIVVALGTNQHESTSMIEVEDFYERLLTIYPSIPVLCITPLWRGETKDNNKALKWYCDGIKKVCEKYDNIIVADGFKLVPNLQEYFLDGLHPNVIGSQIYAERLWEFMRESEFFQNI